MGFATDGGLLWATTTFLHWGPIVARGLSFPVAVLVTWLLNRHVTFRREDDARVGASAVAEYGKYLGVQLFGAGINLAIYSTILIIIPSFRSKPLIPLAIASLMAMTFNYVGSRMLVFRSPPAR